MVCDVCKEADAVVQLTEIEGSGVRLLHLCERCAAERGVETTLASAKPDVSNFLQSVHQQMQATQGDAARCSFLLLDIPRLPHHRTPWLRSLL
jgi:protein arginine kinase activator